MWLVPIDAQREASVAAFLAPAEADRAARIIDHAERRRFVVTRGTTRVVLARVVDCAPADVVIDQRCDRCSSGDHGPLRVRGVRGTLPLACNVSHSGTLGAIAIARNGRVGVDVEQLVVRDDVDAIATVVCTAGERTALAGLAPGERPDAFHRCWTRKEALAKAVGLGVRLPFDEIAVGVGPSPVLAPDGERPPPLVGLHVADLPTVDGHAGAVAADDVSGLAWSLL